MTKSGEPWEAPVQLAIEPQLRHYINVVRPWLLSQGPIQHDILWVGQNGEALGYAAVGDCVVKSTFRATGIKIPPHFFRDSAASTLARQSPGDARLIRPLLAHSSYGTTERHYIQAQGIETVRDHAAVVARLTKGEF
jgi:site-specific recombinase XerD